jgi:hypothetical protein
VPTEGEGFDRLLRWFRQRRLLQVLAIYLGASWLILEITDVFIDKLALPAWRRHGDHRGGNGHRSCGGAGSAHA